MATASGWSLTGFVTDAASGGASHCWTIFPFTISIFGVGLGGNGSGVGVVIFAGVLVTVKSPMLGVRLALGEALASGSVRDALPSVGAGEGEAVTGGVVDGG